MYVSHLQSRSQKKMFYMKSFDSVICSEFGDGEALSLFSDGTEEKTEFVKQVEACVNESQLQMYENAPGSTIKFAEPKEAHEILKDLLVSPLGAGTTKDSSQNAASSGGSGSSTTLEKVATVATLEGEDDLK